MNKILINNSSTELAFSAKGVTRFCSFLLKAGIDVFPCIGTEFGGYLFNLNGSKLCAYDVPRHSKHLIRLFEEMGREAFSDSCDPVIVEIESDKYTVDISWETGIERIIEISNWMIVDIKEENILC